jgi:O-methyltransferase involved in polyketide biosynthesis
MSQKIKIELGKVQETLLLPLWGRAVETQKQNPRLIDKVAFEIINKIDYDFSTISNNINPITQYAWVARSLHTDKTVKEFILKYPNATIVNIGCGMDTTFDRIDNGQITYYELDLPDVINLRNKFFECHDRRKTISCSFFDYKWLPEINHENGLLLISAGVFYYFEENQIKDFIITLADNFSKFEMFFDIASPLGVKLSNKRVIQDSGMDKTAILKWEIKRAQLIEKWDTKIQLIDEYPMFREMKKGFPLKMKFGLMISDMLKIMSMVHLKMRS